MQAIHRLMSRLERPRLPRRTVRLRLSLIYGGLFLLSGACLLAITNYLVRRAASGSFTVRGNGKSMTISVTGGISDVSRSAHRLPVVGGAKGSPGQIAVGPLRGLTPAQAEKQAHQLQTLAVQQHNALLHQLAVGSWIALAIMTGLSMVLGWFVAGRVLRPLRTITAAARDISATNLHERLTLDGPDDELKELGDTFDGLLGRLEASFNAQRRFVANASHELRTPLARQRAVVQVALSDPEATVDTLREAHQRVLASGEQQERMIEALLTLSRAQTGLNERLPFDLADITRHSVDARRSEANARGLDLMASIESANTAGDPRLVERLVVNLIDNAIRHNIEGGSIEVVAGIRGPDAVLTVSNDGPQIEASDVDRLFQPFQRLGAERTGHQHGLGIGLSIVEAVARVHEATLTARPRSQGGLDISVRFAALAPSDGSARRHDEAETPSDRSPSHAGAPR